MDSALDYLIKQGENYIKEYRDFIKDKLIPKRFQGSQEKKAGFLFFKLKKYLKDKKHIKIKELEEHENKDHINGPYSIVLSKNKAIIEKLKELIDKYTRYKLNLPKEEIQTDLDNLKKFEQKVRRTDYLIYKRFDIEDNTKDIEEDYIDEENQEAFCKEVTVLANEVIKDIDSALYHYELKNELERGDVVEIIDPVTDDEETYSLMFIVEKQGEHYAAFKITNDEEPYVTSVKFEKDNNNNLGKDTYIQMDTKYLINKSEVINKIGHTNANALNKISECAKFFQSKNLTKAFTTKLIQKIEPTMNLTNELKWRK